MRQAKQLAANLAHTFKGQPTRPFSFRPLGMLASLGNRTAVAEILGIRLSGFMPGYYGEESIWASSPAWRVSCRS
jgi:NADH dehydrogenase